MRSRHGGHIHPPGHFCGSNCPMHKAPTQAQEGEERMRTYQLGDRVQVEAPFSAFHGIIGVIDEVAPEDEVAGDIYPYHVSGASWFRDAELRLVEAVRKSTAPNADRIDKLFTRCEVFEQEIANLQALTSTTAGTLSSNIEWTQLIAERVDNLLTILQNEARRSEVLEHAVLYLLNRDEQPA